MSNYFPDYFTSVQFLKNHSVAFSVKSEYIFAFSSFLKNCRVLRCKMLIDIFVTDFPFRENRFELTYVFLSTARNDRIYIRTYVAERGSLSSLTPLFPSANWLEREV